MSHSRNFSVNISAFGVLGYPSPPMAVVKCECSQKVSGEPVPAGKIQGETIGGSFNFDDCAVAELAVDPNAEQTCVVLNVESAAEIYLAPHKAHTTLVETIIEKVFNYH